MSDIKLEFDLVTGKNEVNKALDGIKSSAASATNSFSQLGVSASSYGNNLRKAKKDTEEFIDVSSIGMKKPLASFNNLAGAVTVGIAAITGAIFTITEFVSAAIEAEESVSNLNLALKQSGIFSEDASQKFQDLASSIQETTVYSDDQILAMTSLLQNIGNFTEKGLEKATKASIELASAFKMDLNQAAQLVGKAANGNTIAINKLGIEFKKGKTDAETFSNVLEALSKFQGDSAEKAKTLGGSVKSLKNAFGELFETISIGTSKGTNLSGIITSIKNATNEVNKSAKEGFFSGLASTIDEFILKAPAKLGVAIGNSIREAVGLAVKDIGNVNAKIIVNEKNISNQSKLVKDILDVSNFLPKASGVMLSDIAKASNETQKLLLDTKTRQSELFAANEKERQAARKEMLSLADQVKSAGKTQEQAIADETTARLAQIEALYKRGAFKDFKEYTELRLQVEADYQDKIADLDKKRLDESFKIQKENDEKLAKQRQKSIDVMKTALGAISNIFEGVEGAKTAISNITGSIVDRFFPGLGQVFGQLIKKLMSDPEQNREMIRSFVLAGPELLKNIINNIPVIIDELVNQLPAVIDKFTDMLNSPEFWAKFAWNLLKAVWKGVEVLPKALMAALPDFFEKFGEGIIDAIADGLYKALKELVGGIGDIGGSIGGFLGDAVGWVGGAVGSVGDFFGFASGGEIPKGFPNDNFPAHLTSGEVVIDRSTVDKLNSFLDNGSTTQDSSITDALLVQILDKLSQPMQVATSATVNGKAFADIILNLNRSNSRLLA